MKKPKSISRVLPSAIVELYDPKLGEDGVPAPNEPVSFESLPRGAIDHPKYYEPSEGLKAAVNTALLLGMPLLVTGDPGCGKTQLGYSIAHVLRLDCKKFETKSSSQARDLFYVFDAIGRFHAEERDDDPLNFIAYSALGQAILETYDRADVEHFLPPAATGYRHPATPRRSVVIIDEVDKATRDFPNDLLNEIDGMYFRVPELGRKGLAGLPNMAEEGRGPKAPNLRPIVVFTSNSEKRLPDAFLRRCVYFHIREPEDELERRAWLAGIINRRLKDAILQDKAGGQLVSDAIDFYLFLRTKNLAKPPSLAELLNWVQVLTARRRQKSGADTRLADDPALLQKTLVALLKNKDDGDANAGIADEWGKLKTSEPS